MKVNDFAAAITAIIVLGMQVVTGWSVVEKAMTVAEYATIWGPVMAAMMAYWFKGEK